MAYEDIFTYNLSTCEDLARALGVPLKCLKFGIEKGYRHYYKQTKHKLRLIEKPNPVLNSLLKCLAEDLQDLGCPDYNKCGFGGNTLKNAAPHLGQYVVVTTDISSYFPNTKAKYVRKFYSEKLRIHGDALEYLMKMTTYRGHLPTGASTSNMLALFAHQCLFDEIAKEMQKRDITFTLYADDITLSAKHGITREVIQYVRSLLKKHGLKIKAEKTKFYSYKKAHITGVYISQNGKISVPYSIGHEIVQKLDSCPIKEMDIKALRSLIGLINYQQMTDKQAFRMPKLIALKQLRKFTGTKKSKKRRKRNGHKQ